MSNALNDFLRQEHLTDIMRMHARNVGGSLLQPGANNAYDQLIQDVTSVCGAMEYLVAKPDETTMNVVRMFQAPGTVNANGMLSRELLESLAPHVETTMGMLSGSRVAVSWGAGVEEQARRFRAYTDMTKAVQDAGKFYLYACESIHYKMEKNAPDALKHPSLQESASILETFQAPRTRVLEEMAKVRSAKPSSKPRFTLTYIEKQFKTIFKRTNAVMERPYKAPKVKHNSLKRMLKLLEQLQLELVEKVTTKGPRKGELLGMINELSTKVQREISRITKAVQAKPTRQRKPSAPPRSSAKSMKKIAANLRGGSIEDGRAWIPLTGQEERSIFDYVHRVYDGLLPASVYHGRLYIVHAATTLAFLSLDGSGFEEVAGTPSWDAYLSHVPRVAELPSQQAAGALKRVAIPDILGDDYSLLGSIRYVQHHHAYYDPMAYLMNRFLLWNPHIFLGKPRATHKKLVTHSAPVPRRASPRTDARWTVSAPVVPRPSSSMPAAPPPFPMQSRPASHTRIVAPPQHHDTAHPTKSKRHAAASFVDPASPSTYPHAKSAPAPSIAHAHSNKRSDASQNKKANSAPLPKKTAKNTRPAASLAVPSMAVDVVPITAPPANRLPERPSAPVARNLVTVRNA